MPGAEIPRRRTKTAREVAEHLGISIRTVRRFAAEPRADFLARARALRRTGLKYVEIGEQMGVTTAIAGRLIQDAKRIGEWDGVIDQRPDPEDSAQKAS